MRITTHYQGNSSPNMFALSSTLSRKIKVGSSELVFSPMLSVDLFFDEKHNRRYGWISTSPELADNPSAFGHFNPLDGQSALPADTPVEDIHAMVISKDCQSLSEVQALKKLRPVEPDIKFDEPQEPGPKEPVLSTTE